MSLDTKQRVVECASALDLTKRYSVPYDTLVIGVGASPNHFSIPGVQEHAFFLKGRGGGGGGGGGGGQAAFVINCDLVRIMFRKYLMHVGSGTRFW